MWQKRASIFSSPVCYFGTWREGGISGHLLHLNTFQMSFSLFLARDNWLTFNHCNKMTQTCSGCKDNSSVIQFFGWITENWKYEPYRFFCHHLSLFTLTIFNCFVNYYIYRYLNELFLCRISSALGSFSSSSLFLTHVLLLNGVLINQS